jgi:hypothetical protein
MAFQDFELTDDGVALLSQVQAELGSLNFTKMKIGNGTYTGDIKDLTDIVSSFHEFDVSSTGVMDDNSVKVQGTFNNTTFGTSYEFREIGVYAKLGDTGAEILYSYSKDETPDTIPDSSTIYKRTLDIRNCISDVDTVTLTVTEIQDRYDFNTVAEMQTAGYLTEGDRCKTWGYSTLGDKLGNEYEVVAPSTGTDDGWNYINLSGSSVQAKLLSRALTDTGYTVDGFLLGKTELVSDTQYMAGDGYWWKLKSDTTSPCVHDTTDTPDSTYLEKITHKETLDKVESLFTVKEISNTIYNSTGNKTLSTSLDNTMNYIYVYVGYGADSDIKICRIPYEYKYKSYSVYGATASTSETERIVFRFISDSILDISTYDVSGAEQVNIVKIEQRNI